MLVIHDCLPFTPEKYGDFARCVKGKLFWLGQPEYFRNGMSLRINARVVCVTLQTASCDLGRGTLIENQWRRPEKGDGGEKGKTWAKMKEWERRTRLKHTAKRIRERKRGKAGGLGC